MRRLPASRRSETLATVPDGRPPGALFRPVPEGKIVQILLSLGGGGMWKQSFPEIGKSMALAANQDPLLPEHEEGAEATACLLVSWAQTTSRLQPNAVYGKALGLYHIRPPTLLNVSANLLTLPRTASLVAVDLMRRSLLRTSGRPWLERLRPMFQENNPEADPRRAIERSARVLAGACEVQKRFFSRSVEQPVGGSVERTLPALLAAG